VALVTATRPATTVPVTIYRDKARKTLNLTVDELDLMAEQGRSERTETNAEPTSTGFGMDIDPITPDIARELELPRGQGGAIVSNVTPGSPAFNAGVQPHDVILAVNRTPVTSVSQVSRELEKAPPNTPVFLLVLRQGRDGAQQVFLTMRKR
jgi:serine protease Do